MKTTSQTNTNDNANAIAALLAGNTGESPTNLATKIEGTSLTIKVDLTKALGYTQKGAGDKILVANSGGRMNIGGGFVLNLTITRPPLKSEAKQSVA